jgi:hypothetical protein
MNRSAYSQPSTMRSIASRAFSVLFITACAGGIAAGTGCADNNQSIYVRGVIVAAKTDNACTWDPNAQAFSPSGSLELAGGASRYNVVLSYALDLSARGNLKEGRAEPNRAYVRTAEVTLRDENQRTIAAYSVDVSQSLANPGDNAASGVQVSLITPAVLPLVIKAIPANKTLRVFADIRLFATTVGGYEISSALFQYPIDISKGVYVSGILDGRCQPDPAEKPINGCYPGQDGAVIRCDRCAAEFKAICGN